MGWFRSNRNVQIPQKLVDSAFGEVNVKYAGGKKIIVATVLMEPYIEGTQTGVAIDGSSSMVVNGSFGYVEGQPGNPAVRLMRNGQPVQFGYQERENSVQKVCREVVPYLAEKLDADGGTTVIYWACGDGGARVEVIDDMTAERARGAVYSGPSSWGTRTCLLPAVRYFVDRFADAKWGFYVFVTDGALDDLEEVKKYTLEQAREIASGARNPFKCVLIGVGRHIAEEQMAALDDLDKTHGALHDIWDHKTAATMRDLRDIFAEVVDENARVAPFGRVLDDRGRVVREWNDGLPATIEFELAEGAESFRLELAGGTITQTLREG